MLYPSFGPTASDASPSNCFYDALKEKGMNLYKKIYDTNNKASIEAFFNDDLIIKLWPRVMGSYTKEHCFGSKGPVKDILPTYSEITRLVVSVYGLPMPRWWVQKFPMA
jgi:hypothetical protein